MIQELLFLDVAFIARDKRYQFIYLSKDKKEIKKFVLQFALKFLINISCFDEEARGCAFHFVEIFSQNE